MYVQAHCPNCEGSKQTFNCRLSWAWSQTDTLSPELFIRNSKPTTESLCQYFFDETCASSIVINLMEFENQHCHNIDPSMQTSTSLLVWIYRSAFTWYMYVCVATLVLTFPGTWILIGLNKKTTVGKLKNFWWSSKK